MDKVYELHLARIKTAVLTRYTASQIALWLTRNTTYAMQPFDYKDHEFQERILSDQSQELAVRKCSQVGLSETSARKALGLVNVLQPYTVIYTLPTAKFANTFMKTRIDPVIKGSKAMEGNVHRTNDNAEMKQFGDSFLYMKGAASSNAPISIPADHLIHDEVDFCDQEVLSQYTSRLTHSKWKKVDRFSTPTLPGFGVDKAFKESRRHFLFCRCNHCNHWFVPSYYDHVRIPGFTGDLRAINKSTLAKIRWQEGYLVCPACDKQPSLQVEHREWVCENPDEAHVGAGYQVSPFDAPNIIAVKDLIKASTAYDRIQDFINFNLGLPAEDREATLTREDFDGVFQIVEIGLGMAYVMGVDVGNVYHFCVAGITPFGDMLVVHTEQVPMGQARERYHALRARWRVICTVIDSAPHAETVMALQEVDPNCYAAVYMKSKSLLTHNVKERDKDADKGQEFQRQVDINRNRAFDAYMEFLRSDRLNCLASDEAEVIIQHHMSMKRTKVFDSESGEMTYAWQKTDGMDHYHHAFLYCWVAGRIKGVGRSLVQLPLFSMMSMRLQGK